jgi:RNA polymerase sigma-70 factor, ECF subfamily
MSEHRTDITALLRRLSTGDAAAESEVVEALYHQLRQLARAALARERAQHTLQPTVLVHEAFLRLHGGSIDFRDRQHFLALSARAMRRVLVDHARARLAKKRPAPGDRVEFDEPPQVGADPVSVIAIDEALDRLRRLNPRQASIVEMRFFGGLTEEEIAQVLRISSKTVKREWGAARLWLFSWLKESSQSHLT